MDIEIVGARAGKVCVNFVASSASSFALSFPSMPSWPGTQRSEKVALLILSLILSTRFRLSLLFAYANETVWREENVQEETRVVPAARRHLDRLGVKDSLVTPQPQLCHD